MISPIAGAAAVAAPHPEGALTATIAVKSVYTHAPPSQRKFGVARMSTPTISPSAFIVS